jgi:flagellar hook-length control protein FliK
MSRLGPVRAEFTLSGKTLEGMFLVASQTTRECLEASLPMLMDALTEKGFSIQQMGCFVRQAETVMQPVLQEVVRRKENSICLVG